MGCNAGKEVDTLKAEEAGADAPLVPEKSARLIAAEKELGPDRLEQCKNAFLNYDKDDSGSIEASEVKETMRQLHCGNVTEAKLDAAAEKFFRENDANHDGKVTLEEYLVGVAGIADMWVDANV